MNHPVDLAGAALLRWGPEHNHFFTEGWGDDAALIPPDLDAIPAAPIDVRWLPAGTRANATIEHGSFTSPVEGLPSGAALGSVVRMTPHRPTGRVVVLMPAWNEHEPRVRLAIADRLAQRGIGSLILENAYFGSRRPLKAAGHPVTTVADFMRMGSSAVIEARGLLASLAESGSTPGVAGYSMGGNTAALVAASVPFRVAAAPLAASHSPGPVFVEGALRHGVDWHALGGPESAPHLARVLGAVSVLHLPPPDHVADAVIVGARTDGYVPLHTTQALAEHWPGSDLRLEPGGHATLVWLRKDRLVRAITDSFDRAFAPEADLRRS